MATCGIYRIENNENGKFYIGSSVDIQKRWKGHIRLLKKGFHENQHLQNAWNKYGEENFVVGVYRECNPSDLLLEEQKELDVWVGKDDCYNISKSAVCPVTVGEKRQRWIVDKIAVSNTGKQRTPEQVQQMSFVRFGTKHTPETIEKMRGRASSFENIKRAYQSNIGRIYSDEHRRNISNSLKNKSLVRDEKLRQRIRNSVMKSVEGGYGVRGKLNGKHGEIKRMYLSGKYNQKQLSSMYNVTPTSIYRLLTRIGVK